VCGCAILDEEIGAGDLRVEKEEREYTARIASSLGWRYDEDGGYLVRALTKEPGTGPKDYEYPYRVSLALRIRDWNRLPLEELPGYIHDPFRLYKALGGKDPDKLDLDFFRTAHIAYLKRRLEVGDARNW
jgi:hypothetical protein